MSQHDHLEDGALLVLLDEDGAHESMMAHVHSCDSCRRRLDEMRAASDRVRALFADDDRIPLPEGRRRTRHARRARQYRGWAVLAAASLAALLLLTPAGAMVARWFASDPVPPTEPTTVGERRFDFVVGGESVQVLFPNGTPAALSIVALPVGEASLVLRGAGPTDDVTIAGASVEISLASGDSVAVTLTLPNSVTEIQVEGPDGPIPGEWFSEPGKTEREWRSSAPL